MTALYSLHHIATSCFPSQSNYHTPTYTNFGSCSPNITWPHMQRQFIKTIIFSSRYGIMQQCWRESPSARPTFASLSDTLQKMLSAKNIKLLVTLDIDERKPYYRKFRTHEKLHRSSANANPESNATSSHNLDSSQPSNAQMPHSDLPRILEEDQEDSTSEREGTSTTTSDYIDLSSADSTSP